MQLRIIANMDNFAKRLKYARKLRGLTQAQLSEKSGVNQSDISKIESGTHQKSTSLIALAKALNFNPTWLDSGDGTMQSHTAEEPRAEYNTSPVKTCQQIPLISWVRAGDWGQIEDHLPDTEETTSATYSKPGHHAFALRVEGDSMTSNVGLSFPSGCIIIVDPERAPKVGDFVVAKDVATQMATFKRLTSDGGRWYLQPLNKAYAMIEIDNPNQRIIGVVIEFQIGGKL